VTFCYKLSGWISKPLDKAVVEGWEQKWASLWSLDELVKSSIVQCCD
jgi:hypothetical protein